ncbi:3-methyladenine DNA glycosylase AlkD [Algoriphagus boseongensis]|uniref:3-methyladenine DNA glycosylase AlkD n=1 Tax=Algoriphagus boseongensis TaxID=1442587 RepID=A0A4R6T4E8_9BACT|nr:DNA alkylation repair protein [Algoriphagus boseongensis]TDQ17361.1 3-methyladenine DNA glycosylase AlkD [Algoriphagus boseongensis]
MSLLTEQIIEALKDKAIPEKAAFFPKFFKAGPGEYGEGDQFLGVKVPDQRAIAKQFYREISLPELSELIQNPFHEVRLTGLLALVYRFEKEKSEAVKKELVDFYLSHLDFVNNWDLVDTTCHLILGTFYWKKEKDQFYSLADSGHLWRQRIAMISSLYWIKKGEFSDALSLAEKLKNHPHDLMHKAVGWMLREIGNKDFEAEFQFLKTHYRTMPRTALRYAIEKFPEELRQDFLKGRV